MGINLRLLDFHLHHFRHIIGFAAQYINERNFIALLIRPDGIMEGDILLRFLQGSEVHQDFVFNTTRGEGSQLRPLIRREGFDGLNESDGADGDQILQVLSGIVKLLDDMGHQTQVMLNQHIAGIQISPGHQLQMLRFLAFG
ncbi:hypothetical protein D3C87_1652240 [compost metagenome]